MSQYTFLSLSWNIFVTHLSHLTEFELLKLYYSDWCMMNEYGKKSTDHSSQCHDLVKYIITNQKSLL